MTTRIAKRWPLLRVLLTSHLSFVAVLWVMFILGVLLVTTVVAIGWNVEESILHYAATQAPRWLMFGLGIDAVSTYLRIHLAHGRTRREFTGQVTAYAALLSGFTAVLITLGYLLERGVYALFGWPQALDRPGVFTAPDQYPVILGTYWLNFLMWAIAGVVIGLGFFRSAALGLLTIPLGIVIVLPSVVAMRNGGLPVIGSEFIDLDVGNGVVLAACAGLIVVAVGLVWAIVRDVPMKSTAT